MKQQATAATVCLAASMVSAVAGAQVADAPLTTANVWTRYGALLRAVVRRGGVDYAGVRERLGELRLIHAWLGEHGPTATPAAFASANARKAYWLNAYNATVLLGVAEAPATMRNVMTYLPDGGFFRARHWRLDGRELTLDAVENREVRPVFRDPRVHMALNCGARSCPPLYDGAYVPGALDRQLDALARGYVNAASNVAVDEAARAVRVAQIFEWFRDDFAGAGGVVAWLRSYAAPTLRAALEAACGADAGACTVRYRRYDWSLNSATPTP
ncbi:MAG: DUF547 domain-containing protein [Myxococcaceae bacterium]|nr:MAG: DUF547 domain-containing protein [Myxococcaceae bacterium]